MLELYHNNISVCAQKVRLVLAEKNVPWENRHIDLKRGDHLKPEFLKVNPRGLVPVLVHDGEVVIEIDAHLRLSGRRFPPAAVEAERALGARADATLEQDGR